jgi:hypothetical protein
MDSFRRIKNSNLNESKNNLSQSTEKALKENPSKSQASFLMESNTKDLIISNQKTHIYQLEQREKDIDNLNKKFNDLQKDFNDVNDYRLVWNMK